MASSSIDWENMKNYKSTLPQYKKCHWWIDLWQLLWLAWSQNWDLFFFSYAKTFESCVGLKAERIEWGGESILESKKNQRGGISVNSHQIDLLVLYMWEHHHHPKPKNKAGGVPIATTTATNSASENSNIPFIFIFFLSLPASNFFIIISQTHISSMPTHFLSLKHTNSLFLSHHHREKRTSKERRGRNIEVTRTPFPIKNKEESTPHHTTPNFSFSLSLFNGPAGPKFM